ncbi:methyltransferase domain-containing protein [Heliobacterium gestii]|uniref:Methyltransferase domain-containing protein n=1 Tax=Heliomicrobium gestii TaxID=2699 RepID=A0A845L9Y6_HELGE|nr:class I SAM-dependent methyltransferase [Heliomicrobium gestii]MBM7866692.1 SAM-dependent methyltransferase [Heliomicrobium gestii]MZP43028.1 methyltransferase domain-containing protein [Heliomicrobium gestii]
MNQRVVAVPACKLCGQDDLERVLELTPTPVADDYHPRSHIHIPQDTYPLDVCLCKSCGNVQLGHIVNPESIYKQYNYMTQSSPGLLEHFRGYVTEALGKAQPEPGKLVVDIGSNDGTLLREFQAKGMRVLGIDPAEAIARKATEEGVETIGDFFTPALADQIVEKYGQAHIITANNMLANVEDVKSVIEGIRRLLAPTGVFIFETGYVVDLVQHGVFDNIYHEHLYYFSVKPLERFFAENGLALYDVQAIPTKGGSIRGFVQHAAGGRLRTEAVQRFLDREAAVGIHQPEAFHRLGAKLDEVREQLHRLLGEIREQGKTAIGYGASHSVTTLIYHFGLGDKLDYLVDDNPRKIDLFSPGYRLPVLNPSVIYERNPDYIVILPWRFADLIIGKHQRYLEQGGRFVVPLSEFRIVE